MDMNLIGFIQPDKLRHFQPINRFFRLRRSMSWLSVCHRGFSTMNKDTKSVTQCEQFIYIMEKLVRK